MCTLNKLASKKYKPTKLMLHWLFLHFVCSFIYSRSYIEVTIYWERTKIDWLGYLKLFDYF